MAYEARRRFDSRSRIPLREMTAAQVGESAESFHRTFDADLRALPAGELDHPDSILGTVLRDAVKDIQATHGPAVAQDFAGIACGTRTPMLHYMDRYLGNTEKQRTLTKPTINLYRSYLNKAADWLAGKNARTVESVTPPLAADYVQSLVDARTNWKTINKNIDALVWLRGEMKKVGVEADPWGAQRDCTGGWFRVRTGKTKAAKRKIPIHPDLVPIVAQQAKGKAPGDYLLYVATAGDRRSAVLSRQFTTYRRSAGVEELRETARSAVNFHSCRRWLTTAASSAGALPIVVDQLTGHAAKGETLKTYFGGSVDDVLRKAIEAVRLPA
jgi:hypothetical protein